MKLRGNVLLFILMLFFALSAHAADSTPVQLSLVNPVQLFPEDTTVNGLRINLLYGVNKEVNGVDIGPINRTTGTTRGVQLGAFPYGGINVTGNLRGVQFGGIFGGVNIATGDVTGVQLAGLIGGINAAGNLHGAQISGTFIGINLAKDVKGLQLTTMYNQADAMEGLQLGLVNVCKRMKGVQIGLVNVIKENSVPFIPIVNASF